MISHPTTTHELSIAHPGARVDVIARHEQFVARLGRGPWLGGLVYPPVVRHHGIERGWPRAFRTRGRRVAALMPLLVIGIPAVAQAHSISGRVDSPLPFVAYILGAAVAVAASFVIVVVGDPKPPDDGPAPRPRTVPRWLRTTLRVVGLVAWLWILAQALAGGTSDADVAFLFLWVYGWVGLPLLSAFVGPVWAWLDPFTTIYDILAAVGRRLGMSGVAAQPWPDRLGIWPAVAGLAFFVWLELVAMVLQGRSLALVLIGYTVITLLGMAQYGRDTWRSHGETFSVWLGIVGRLAPFALDGTPDEGRVIRRPFARGLLTARWSVASVVTVAVGTGSIIFDGLSQTQTFYDLFSRPDVPFATVLLALFLGGLAALVLLVARSTGLAAVGAGLLPVAMGYLVAHYLSYLLADGQRIVVAISDPLQQGWDLFGTAFYEPDLTFIPAGAFWGVQVGAVIVGHIVGAWAGHAVAARERGDDHGRGRASRAERRRAEVRAQLPLAILMVALTALTLWSLGQALVFTSEPEHQMPAVLRSLGSAFGG